MSFCKDCVKGVTHEGTAKGKWEIIGGVETYVATPEVGYPKDKAVIFLTDIFGNKLSPADDFAGNGFKTYIPDYLNGDPAPLDAMTPGSTFDIYAWFGSHGVDQTRPTLDKFLAAIKDQGVTTFGATGYCFGGRYVFDLGIENIVKVGATSHPSLLNVPDDFTNYAEKSQAPLLINNCIDELFPPEAAAKADEILGGGKFKPGYRRDFYDGCHHGFAIRGDLSDPKVKAGKEESFKGTVEWFLKYL